MKKEQITTIRLPVKLYEKIRLMSYKNRDSINNIMVNAIINNFDKENDGSQSKRNSK